MVSEKVLYGADRAGCWFDCARGIYIGEAVIRLAAEHGFDVSDLSVTDGRDYAELEHYCELWDEAEQYMDQFAAEGFWFGANESGDWGLWASEEE